jgi:hypothetical protein
METGFPAWCHALLGQASDGSFGSGSRSRESVLGPDKDPQEICHLRNVPPAAAWGVILQDKDKRTEILSLYIKSSTRLKNQKLNNNKTYDVMYTHRESEALLQEGIVRRLDREK